MSQGKAFVNGHLLYTAFDVRIFVDVPETSYDLYRALIKYQTYNSSKSRSSMAFPILSFLSHQEIRITTKVITFQSSAVNIKQLYVSTEA